MFPETIGILRCPVDGGRLELAATFEKSGEELVEGVLACASCGRWFRIERGVADLVRDGLREDADEAAFVARHSDNWPGGLTRSGHPTIEPSPGEEAIRSEGRHWAEHFRAYWDAGDRTIFDMDIQGTHRRFYTAGVLAEDLRDVGRRYGHFPTAAGRVLYSGEELHGLALELGAGGGQFGLSLARRHSLRVMQTDPSLGALVLARGHARATGVSSTEHVRSEPSAPPFAAATFDALLCKDVLHHVPDLGRVLANAIGPVLKDGARFVLHEHVGVSAAKRWILGRIAGPSMRKILRRFPTVPIPPALLRESSNEDVSMREVVDAVRRHFHVEAEARGVWVHDAVEGFVYYAFGRRRWFSRIVRASLLPVEWALIAAGQSEYWSARGRLRAR